MAVNLVEEGNILKVNSGGAKVLYWNKAWVSLYFDSTNVYLVNNSLPFSNDAWALNPYPIALADCQVGGVAKTTEADIVTALSTIIG